MTGTDGVAELMAAEQALYARTHARSRTLYEQGKTHWLYGAPSHWMRRWMGGWPVAMCRSLAFSRTTVSSSLSIWINAMRDLSLQCRVECGVSTRSLSHSFGESMPRSKS